MTSQRISQLGRLAISYAPFIGSLAVRGLEVVSKLGLYMLAARLLGVHDAGVLFICLTWIGLTATLARMGFDRAVMRHLAAEIAVNNMPAARQVTLIGLGWVTLGGVLVTLFTVIAAGPLARYAFSDPALAEPLMLAAASILPQALCVFVSHILYGMTRGVIGQFIQNAFWPTLTILVLILGVRSLDGLLYTVAAGNILATMIGAVICLRFFIRSSGSTAPEVQPAADRPSSLWRTALPLSLVEIVQISLNSLPLLILTAFASPSVVGAFGIASRIAMLIWVVIISIGTMAGSSFSALHRLEDWDGMRAQNRRVRRFVALSGIAPIAIMMIFPTWLLHLVAPGFDIASTALVIMAVGQLINCLLPCQDVVLAMTGHGGVLRWLSVAQLAVCIVASAILIPLFGMNGAAALTSLVIIQGAIGTTLAVRRLMPRAF